MAAAMRRAVALTTIPSPFQSILAAEGVASWFSQAAGGAWDRDQAGNAEMCATSIITATNTIVDLVSIYCVSIV